jgi:hypothetical protein
LHTGETKTMCACMSTIQSILCICRSSRHMLVNARFRIQHYCCRFCFSMKHTGQSFFNC